MLHLQALELLFHLPQALQLGHGGGIDRRGLAHQLAIDAPFMEMHKSDVIRLGHQLGVPLELTLSCMNPRRGLHCGECSKCRERRDAFREAGIEDLTPYQRLPIR